MDITDVTVPMLRGMRQALCPESMAPVPADWAAASEWLLAVEQEFSDVYRPALLSLPPSCKRPAGRGDV